MTAVFDLESLDLPKKVTAEDACANLPDGRQAGKPLKIDGNKASVNLKSQAWTLIWIRPI